MSMSSLVGQVGVDTSYLSRIEGGERGGSIHFYAMLANALALTHDERYALVEAMGFPLHKEDS